MRKARQDRRQQAWGAFASDEIIPATGRNQAEIADSGLRTAPLRHPAGGEGRTPVSPAIAVSLGKLLAMARESGLRLQGCFSDTGMQSEPKLSARNSDDSRTKAA